MATDVGVGKPDYHQTFYSERSWTDYTRILGTIVRHAPPGRILDLGAGCGYFVEAARRWNISATGLDGSEAAVQMARCRDPEIDVRVHRLSSDLPFEGNFFSTVVLNQVIEHLEPDVAQGVLHEAHRVLSPGGMIFIASPSCFNETERKADPTHVNLMSPSHLKEIVEASGFDRIISFDSPLPILGSSWLGRGMMELFFKIFPIERLSATSNLMAFKQYDT